MTTTELLYKIGRTSNAANLEMSGYSIPVRVDTISGGPFEPLKFGCRAISPIGRVSTRIASKPAKVIFNPPATIVYWGDGTKTVVKCSDNDQFDKTMGLAMAMCKKMYGNTGSYNEIFKKFISTDIANTNEPTITDNAEAKIGDKLRFEIVGVGDVVATVQQVTDTDILYMTDDCIMEAPMNDHDNNEGGYDKSELKKTLDSLVPFFPDDIRDKVTYIAPPTYGQMFGHDDWYERALEPDDDEQLPLMKIRKNRIADYENDYSWYWLKNATKESYSASNFALVSNNGTCDFGNASYSSGVRVVFRLKR